MSDKNLDSSNNHMGKLKKITQHSISFPKAFEEVSKNEGISFLILDPTETHLQILHHDHVLRGSWTNPTKKLIAVLGFDEDAKPVQIAHKSVKTLKRDLSASKLYKK
jgi:penicillin-binding protein-related factor A (putative recombinase)